MKVDGARVLVTGGSRGIGAACVELFRQAGASVGVLDLDPLADDPFSIACDVADETQVTQCVAQVSEQLGGLDIAILNAGIGGFSPLIDMTVTEWDRVLDVNLKGTFLTMREVARTMVGRTGGSIVVVSSISGFLTERGMGHYNVSKGAVNQLVRVGARELAPRGIRVNAIAPGTTDTPLFAKTKGLPGYWEKLERRTALGRIGTPDDIAQAVMAIAGLEWVTGQVLVADGGVSLWSPIDPMEEMEDR
jgi:NAD(P)-dependent dehydrogenase (short-subunit alcohol dehydrogenase family)